MKVQRTLPPTAAPISAWNLLCAAGSFWGDSTYRDRLCQEFTSRFTAEEAFLVSSGKAALTVILKALKATSSRRRVVIPAYTCYSVPSAIIRAGLEVVLCDIEPASLDYDYSELERLLNDQVLCVVSTHLFGHAANVERVKQLCRGKGIVVVEDAAQALGARSESALLGSLGDVAFFSLGRGKNITCGTGGIILARSASMAQAIRNGFAELEEPPRVDVFLNWVKMAVMRVFIHPVAYWIPSGLPFLHLGETRFYTDFPIYRMDEVRARQLRAWDKQLDQANQERIACAKLLIQDLAKSDKNVTPIVGKESVYLRLPVLVRDRATKESICRRSRAVGAGLSENYPTIIQEIPELIDRLEKRQFPGAQDVVDRLVTLPTHRFVRDLDRWKIMQLFATSDDRPLATPPAGSNTGRHPDSPHVCSAGSAV